MRIYHNLVGQYLNNKFHGYYAALHAYAAVLAATALVMHVLAVAYHIGRQQNNSF